MITDDYVVLLHGIFRTNRSMKPVEKYFVKAGYQVINLSYPSLKKDIGGLAEHLHETLKTYKIDPSKKIHFIGYSLGGLIVRAYLKKYRPDNLGRVVMLGTPNQGSQVADFVQKIFFYKYLYGPAGLQLGTDQAEFEHLFGPVDYDLGIIAGNRTIDPVLSMLLPGPNDGKVTVERTKLAGMKDHIVIPVSHTFMPNKEAVKQQALHFIEHGSFLR